MTTTTEKPGVTANDSPRREGPLWALRRGQGLAGVLLVVLVALAGVFVSLLSSTIRSPRSPAPTCSGRARNTGSAPTISTVMWPREYWPVSESTC